jgi:hypothetical protein
MIRGFNNYFYNSTWQKKDMPENEIELPTDKPPTQLNTDDFKKEFYAGFPDTTLFFYKKNGEEKYCTLGKFDNYKNNSGSTFVYFIDEISELNKSIKRFFNINNMNHIQLFYLKRDKFEDNKELFSKITVNNNSDAVKINDTTNNKQTNNNNLLNEQTNNEQTKNEETNVNQSGGKRKSHKKRLSRRKRRRTPKRKT